MKSQIYLIRHGRTEANQKNLYYGATDLPLTPEGVNQLTKLTQEGIYPTREDIDLYTTGLRRTEQTLFLIFGRRERVIIPELREISFGEFEMKSYEELKDLPAFQNWAADETGTMPAPGGESFSQFAERVQKGFLKLKTLHQKVQQQKERYQKGGKEQFQKDEGITSVVICHGGTISAIMFECFGEGKEDFYEWVPDPGHGYVLDLEDDNIVDYNAF